MNVVLCLILAFGVSVLVTYCVLIAGRRWQILDHPGPRSSHVRPTPTLGGIGTVVGFGCALLWARQDVGPALADGLLAGMTVLLIAIVDDVRRPLKVREKLGLQGVAVGAWAMFGQSLEWQEVLGLPVWATFCLVILWLLGWMNVYNFMDGIDGITAVNTIACCGWLSAVLWVLESPIWWLPMLAVAAAAGFLLLNAPPARIFMGDVGSLNLGFITALFVLIAVQEGTPPAAALFIFGYYLYDGGSTLLRRMLRGENPTTRHREHLYQRLTQVGWTHLRVDGAVVVLSCLFGGAALTLAAGRMSLFGIVFAAAVASIAFLERTAAKYR